MEQGGENNYAFIDASNLFYGGEKDLGWRIDYQKLFIYLQRKYNISRILYFGGVEIYNFKFDYLQNDSVDIETLEKYLSQLIAEKGLHMNEAMLVLIGRHLQRVRFYIKLKQFGYELYLKPVKMYEQEDGATRRKANCDVDMAFHLMNEKINFRKVIILSGDGDFLPILKHMKGEGKEVIILARGSRTAREIRQFAGSNFRDFEYLKHLLKMEEK